MSDPVREMQAIGRAVALFRHQDDNQIVPPKIAAIVLGLSERSVRRHPHLRRYQVSLGRYGFLAGDIRKVARGEAAA